MVEICQEEVLAVENGCKRMQSGSETVTGDQK